MAITDNLLVHVQPQAGDTFIKNRVDDADVAGSGAGSITLVDDSGLYGWNVQGARTGTFAGGAGYEGGAVTLAIRFKCVSRGANFNEYFVARAAGGTGFGPRISNAGSTTGTLRAREIMAAGTTTEVGVPTYTTGDYITIVLKCVDSSVGDGLHAFWLGQVGRVGDAPDATAASVAGTRDPALAYLAWGLSGENITFTDVLLWQRGLTDAEAAAVADDIGNAIPSGGGDETEPTLTSPTGAATGSTTASGSVSTDEGNGTLYAVCTTSATPPSAAQVQAGQDNASAAAAYATSQAVSGTGTQNVNATGLTPETAYYWHFQHQDAAANDSTVSTSSSFTTDATPAPGGGAVILNFFGF